MLHYDEEYAIQQVCENGHQITGCYKVDALAGILNIKKEPKKFCEDCGAATMIACPSCDTKIQGDRLKDNYGKLDTVKYSVVPSYCRNCGKPYPWAQNKIKEAIQILCEFGELSDTEKETIEKDVKNITKDVPGSKISAMRIGRICLKAGKVAYDEIKDIATTTTAKIIDMQVNKHN